MEEIRMNMYIFYGGNRNEHIYILWRKSKWIYIFYGGNQNEHIYFMEEIKMNIYIYIMEEIKMNIYILWWMEINKMNIYIYYRGNQNEHTYIYIEEEIKLKIFLYWAGNQTEHIYIMEEIKINQNKSKWIEIFAEKNQNRTILNCYVITMKICCSPLNSLSILISFTK